MTSSYYAQDHKSNKYPAKILFDINPQDTIDYGHLVFANTTIKEGGLYANSGRAIIAIGKGKTLKIARDNAYKLVDSVDFEDKHYRKDIAYQALAT